MQVRGLRWDEHVAFDVEQQQQQQQQQHVWAGVHVRSGDKAMEAETFAIRECVARSTIVTICSLICPPLSDFCCVTSRLVVTATC